jgi:hypothetical protein
MNLCFPQVSSLSQFYQSSLFTLNKYLYVIALTQFICSRSEVLTTELLRIYSSGMWCSVSVWVVRIGRKLLTPRRSKGTFQNVNLLWKKWNWDKDSPGNSTSLCQSSSTSAPVGPLQTTHPRDIFKSYHKNERMVPCDSFERNDMWLKSGHSVISKRTWIPMTYTAAYQVGISSNTVLLTYIWRYLVWLPREKAAFENFCGYFRPILAYSPGATQIRLWTLFLWNCIADILVPVTGRSKA